MPGNVAGVLLAAGSGSRLGRPKALVVVGGRTLVSRGITLLRDGGADPVVVVTGAAELSGEPDAGVSCVHNPHWATGMGSSLAVGLGAVPDRCAAAVIALADQPLVGSESVRRLISAYGDGASVAVACYDGQPRNPVLLSRPYWPEVVTLATGDLGARAFLRRHPDLVTSVECADAGRPDDIDSPEDLARIEQLLSSGGSAASRSWPARPTAG